MVTISQLLWFAAGVDASIMEQCPPRERMRYALFGTAVFIPTFLALFGSASALTYLTDSWQLIACISVAWAFIVFSLDRLLMMDDGTLNFGFILRFGLAICVSFVLSLPLELKMFEESLTKLITSTEKAIAKEHRSQIEGKIETIEKTIKDLDDSWKLGRREYIVEIEGTGGSGVRGESSIAFKKKQYYKEDSINFAPKILALKKDLEFWRKKATDDEINNYVKSVVADDLLARIAALDKLASSNKHVEWAIWLIRCLLILLEIIPVSVKLSIGKKGVYAKLQESVNQTVIEVNNQLQNENAQMKVLFERLENINKRLKARLEHGKIRATSIFERLKFQQDEILRGIEEKKKFELELLQTELDDVTRIVVEKTKERVFQEFFEGVTTLFDEPNNN